MSTIRNNRGVAAIPEPYYDASCPMTIECMRVRATGVESEWFGKRARGQDTGATPPPVLPGPGTRTPQ